jgi:hypothetical protein
MSSSLMARMAYRVMSSLVGWFRRAGTPVAQKLSTELSGSAE